MPCKKCKDDKYKYGETGSCKYATKKACEDDNPGYTKYDKDKANTTKITELVISDDNQDLAIDCISLVSQPAIEVDFVYLNKQKNNLTFSKINEHKKEIVSPALIPDKSIFRYDPNTQSEFYVYFSKETVRQASILYLKNNNHHKATLQHEERIAGILTVESWIVEDPKNDKSSLYGFNMPKGTWMVKLQVNNDEIWERIVNQEIKGLSIEGYFIDKLQKMAKVKNEEPTDEEVLTALAEILKPQAKKINLNAFTDARKKITKLAGTKLDNADKLLDELQNQKKNIATRIKGLNKAKTDIGAVHVDYMNVADQASKDFGIPPAKIPDFKRVNDWYFYVDGKLAEIIADLKKYI